MNRTLLGAAVAALVIGHPGEGWAQHQDRNVTLHLSDRWDECAFQLDPALTQDAWRQFTEEAGLVAYFRPLADARPLGRGRVELSLMQWATAIDDTDAAWNDTFVHPTADHWLFDGSRLPIPALSVRVGVGDRTDVGAVFTKNPNANYGFFGGLVQQNFNPALAIDGVLLTMYDSRLNLCRQVAEDAKEYFGAKVFRTVIPRNVRLAEAPSFGKPILLYDAQSAGARGYLSVGQELQRRVDGGSAPKAGSRTSGGDA